MTRFRWGLAMLDVLNRIDQALSWCMATAIRQRR